MSPLTPSERTELIALLDSSQPLPERWRDRLFPAAPTVGDNGGEPGSFTGLCCDLSRHTQIEEALRESRQLLQAIVDNSTAAIYVKDASGRYLVFNPECERLLHVTKDQALGKTDHELVANQADADRFRANDRLVLETNQPITTEETAEFPDGRHITISVKVPVRDAWGQPFAVCGISTDITARRRADEAVRAAARDWQVTFDAVQDAIWVLDPDQRIQRCNKAAEALFGRDAAAMIGRPCWEIVHGTSEPVPDCPFRRLGRSEYRKSMELRLGEGWYQVDVDPLRDETGALRGAVHIISTITERKRAEKALQQVREELERRVVDRTAALRASQEQFESFMRHLPAIAFLKDKRGRYVFYNETWEKVFPALAETWQGKTDRELWPAPVAARLRTNDRRVMRTRSPLQAIEKTEGPGGTRHWLVNKFPIFDPKGRVILLGGTAVDVTDRVRAEQALQESEEKYRVLFETSRDATMTLDRRGFLDCNQAALDVFGCVSKDQFIAKHPAEFSPARQPDGRNSRTAARAYIEAAYARGSQFFAWRHRHLDGTVFPAEVLLSRFKLRGQTVLQAVVRDITERKRLEEEILRISDREQHRIAQDLHDGLGQKLTGTAFLVSALSQRLARGNKADARAAERIADLLETAIADTRQLARGLHPVLPEPEGLLDALQQLAKGASQLFKIRCYVRGSPPVLIADNATATHLFRIAQEAVTNAIKHGHAPQVRISLSRGRRGTILRVRDNGRGLPRSLPTPHGLGLQIMRYRAALIGAAVQVQRAGRRGTVVTCTLTGPARPKTSPHHTSR